MKTILFDIDGTLLLTGGAGLHACNKAFDELFGIAETWGKTNPHGKTDRLIFKEIAESTLSRSLTDEELERLTDRYIEYFKIEIDKPSKFRLMPGVPELLADLSKTKDVCLGIETGNFEQTAWLKLKRGSIDSYFLTGGFGSDSELRPEIIECAIKRMETKLNSSLESITVIGDAPQDILAAKEVGVRAIGVATGRSSVEELLSHGADHAFANLSNLAHIKSTL